MDNKKKILLGDKDIISKDNEDLFFNINLNSTFNTIRNDKFENIFDVDKQFKKERNSSKNFRIYGIVDSTVADMDNINIEVYTNSGSTGVFNQITATTSTALVYSEKNVFGKKRGKFIVELDDYQFDFVYLKIPSNNLNYKDQFYVQQLIFRDADGLFVEYGTKTIDINDNLEAVEINNDFYFLYNKHWIKKDLLVVEEKPAKIFINTIGTGPESINEATNTSDRTTIVVSLDKPSPFGLERADIGVLQTNLDLNEIVFTDFNFNSLSLPHTMSFAPGEQDKLFYFYSPLDNIQEFIEGITFELNNFQSVSTGTPISYSINIVDKTPRNKVKINFQDVYENRNYFTGRAGTGGTSSSVTRYSKPMPAVLRNGLFFEGTPMEFYPSDGYTIKIKNVGSNTILPINNRIGIAQEQLFLTNQELTFNITQEYTNTEKNSIKLTFKNLNSVSSAPSYYSYNNGFMINGIPFVKYGYNFRISYNEFLGLFKRQNPPGYPSTIDGWSYGGISVPFDIAEDVANLTLTLTAKNPGIRLDLYSFGVFPNLFEISEEDYEAYGVRAEIVQEFVHGSQVPLVIELGANTGNNLFAQYQFTINKTGYDGMSFICSPMPAGLIPNTYYMVSGLNTILRNWNDSTNSVVYKHENVTSNWGSNTLAANPTYGQYKIGDVYINGMVLLANQYLSNTLFYSSQPQSSPALNSSHAINSSGDFSHDFLPDPINVIPDTTSDIATTNVGQYGYLVILKPNFGTFSTPPVGTTPERSFDFRTGGTGAYNTYYTNDYYNYGGFMWNSSSSFYSSGGTIPSTNSTALPKTLKVLMESGQSPAITPQGIQGVGASLPSAYYNEFIGLYGDGLTTQHTEGVNTLSIIRLETETPGVPFEITNIKEIRYLTGPNAGTNYTENSIFYLEARPNLTAGVSSNPGKNFMGGFSVTHP